MKKIFAIFTVLAVFSLGLVLAGCPADGNADDNNTNGGGGNDVSFDSFDSPSIYVNNESGSRLVAFKGSLNHNTLISGIPAYAANHGLKKDPALFSATENFTLILITENDYTSNKNNITAAPVFARLYAFYNHEAANASNIKISSKLGGTGRITLNNTTSYNIEIRQNSPTGEALGFVAANMTNAVLRVEAPGNYDLFPVIKTYNNVEKIIYEVFPKYTTGEHTGQPYMKHIVLDTANGIYTWDMGELLNENINLTSGSVYF